MGSHIAERDKQPIATIFDHVLDTPRAGANHRLFAQPRLQIDDAKRIHSRGHRKQVAAGQKKANLEGAAVFTYLKDQIVQQQLSL